MAGERGMRKCKNAYCYVNSNFMIMLIRGDPKASSFAKKSVGCLFSSRPHLEEELVFNVSDREKLDKATRKGAVVLRGMGRATRAASEALAWRMIEALSGKETLSETDKRDLWHLAAAVALGARYFVTADKRLCSWINSEYRDELDELARQYFNRPLPYCIDWEQAGECPSGTQENRLLQGSTGQAGSDRGRRPPGEGARGNRRVGKGKNNLEASGKKARGAGKKVRQERGRKGKVAGRGSKHRAKGKGG